MEDDDADEKGPGMYEYRNVMIQPLSSPHDAHRPSAWMDGDEGTPQELDGLQSNHSSEVAHELQDVAIEQLSLFPDVQTPLRNTDERSGMMEEMANFQSNVRDVEGLVGVCRSQAQRMCEELVLPDLGNAMQGTIAGDKREYQLSFTVTTYSDPQVPFGVCLKLTKSGKGRSSNLSHSMTSSKILASAHTNGTLVNSGNVPTDASTNRSVLNVDLSTTRGSLSDEGQSSPNRSTYKPRRGSVIDASFPSPDRLTVGAQLRSTVSTPRNPTGSNLAPKLQAHKSWGQKYNVELNHLKGDVVGAFSDFKEGDDVPSLRSHTMIPSGTDALWKIKFTRIGKTFCNRIGIVHTTMKLREDWYKPAHAQRVWYMTTSGDLMEGASAIAHTGKRIVTGDVVGLHLSWDADGTGTLRYTINDKDVNGEITGITAPLYMAVQLLNKGDTVSLESEELRASGEDMFRSRYLPDMHSGILDRSPRKCTTPRTQTLTPRSRSKASFFPDDVSVASTSRSKMSMEDAENKPGKGLVGTSGGRHLKKSGDLKWRTPPGEPPRGAGGGRVVGGMGSKWDGETLRVRGGDVLEIQRELEIVQAQRDALLGLLKKGAEFPSATQAGPSPSTTETLDVDQAHPNNNQASVQAHQISPQPPEKKNSRLIPRPASAHPSSRRTIQPPHGSRTPARMGETRSPSMPETIAPFTGTQPRTRHTPRSTSHSNLRKSTLPHPSHKPGHDVSPYAIPQEFVTHVQSSARRSAGAVRPGSAPALRGGDVRNKSAVGGMDGLNDRKITAAAQVGDAEECHVILGSIAAVVERERLVALALQEAAKEGHVTFVQSIANMWGQEEACDGAMLVAAQRGVLDVCEALLDQGANVDACGDDGATSLILAACQGHKEVVQLFISRGAHVNATDADGYTSLMWASFKGQQDTALALLQAGADVAKVSKKGNTALIYAAFSNSPLLVTALLQRNVDIQHVNAKGLCARDIAIQQGHSSLAALFDAHVYTSGGPDSGA